MNSYPTEAEVLERYSGPAEIVRSYAGGRVLIVHFHEEPVRAWGFDVVCAGERVSTTNTQGIAESVAPWFAERGP